VSNDNKWVFVGRFGRPHGVKGYIRVHSFTEPKTNLLTYSNWHTQLKGHWQPLKRLVTEEHNRFFVVLLEAYADREKVAELTNLDIAINANQLPRLEAGEFYWRHLVGMTVKNIEDVVLGTVSEVISTGANDVLVVTGDTRQLIPFLYGVVVLDVNEITRQIRVDWDNEYL
jgi:16S rRNA processing protein RimM